MSRESFMNTIVRIEHDAKKQIEPAANDDQEVISLEVWYTDYLDRKLFCVVGWNGATQCADWIDAFDENGSKVDCCPDTRDAIVRKALS